MELAELHDRLYDILCAIDDACTAEGVSYMLGGGTLLGAIRHKGFIPWDDDADICIWYDDFPAFKRAMEKHLPSYYRLQEPEGMDPYFFDFIARVQDTRYRWHESTEIDEKYGNMQNHIAVDVFMVAPSARTKIGNVWQTMKSFVVYGFALGHRAMESEVKYTLPEKIVSGILGGIGKHIPMSKIHQMQHKLYDSKCKQRDKYNFCKICNDLPKYFFLKYQTEWFADTVRVPFRDRMLPVQSGYHEKLTLQYGNYMEPPKDRSEFVQHFGEKGKRLTE